MKHFITTLLTIAAACFAAFAQSTAPSSYTLKLEAKNGMNLQQLEAMFYILNPDSTIVDSIKTPVGIWIQDGVTQRHLYQAQRVMKLVPGSEMLVKATCPDFDTDIVPFNVPAGKQREIDLTNIKLYPLPDMIELGEVVVKHSRVKMVMKGDTILFDAAKFQLAHGDMLSQMMKQMDGLSIDKGVIYMNGRKVDDLCVNGESFFKGDISVAMNNLPAFTVKNIQFYEKAPESAAFTGEVPGEEKDYVIDVTLKKEYINGYLGNIEGGYGSSDRYIARGFGLGFGQNFRLSAFANVNNIQNVQTATASSSGDWDSRGTGGWEGGNADRRLAGIDYIYSPSKALKLKGELNMQHNSQWIDEITSTTYFLESGNRFSSKVMATSRREMRVSTDHSFQLTKDHFYMELRPQVHYNHFNTDVVSRTALFTAPFSESYRGEAVDSVFSRSASTLWTRDLLYRNYNRNRERPVSLTVKANYDSRIKFHKDATDYLTIAALINYTRSDVKGLQDYSLNYATNPTAGTAFNRYILDKPHRLEEEGCVAYDWRSVPNSHDVVVSLRPYASFNHTTQNKDHRLYPLDGLDIDNQGFSIALTDSIKKAIDRANSYWSEQRTSTSKVRMQATLAKSVNLFSVMLSAGMNMRHASMDFNKPDFFQTLSKNYYLPEAGLTIRSSKRGDKIVHNVYLNVTYSEENPELFYLVDSHNSANPLEIYLSNPNLKKPSALNGNINCSLSFPKISTHIYGYISADFLYNRTIQARDYNPTTAVTTFTPISMNGSNNFYSGFYASFNIWKGLRGAINYNANGQRSVEWLTDGTWHGRNAVTTFSQSPGIRLNWDQNNLNIVAGFNYAFDKSHSKRPGYGEYSRRWPGVDFDVEYTLPWKMKLLSDFRATFARGSQNQAMNQDVMSWGIRLSQPLFNDKLSLTLIASDILNKRRSTYSFANVNMAYDTWTSQLPRYVMLTVGYKFNYNPHK